MDAKIQRALVHPKRTKILGYLMQRESEAGTDENELADSLGLTTANVKYHLTVLRDANLISRTDHLDADALERYRVAASPGK